MIVTAAALLSVVAVSRTSAWRWSPGSIGRDTTQAIDAPRSNALAPVDRLRSLPELKRVEAKRQVSIASLAFDPVGLARPLASVLSPPGSNADIEPIALCLGCRGPPSIIAR